MRRVLILLAFAVGAFAQPIPGQPCARTGTATNGQVLTSTGGNGCSFQAAAGGGTGNAADPEAYTPGSTVTLTCGSSSRNTVTTFTPSGALAANMAVTFASCTPGQLVVLKVTQAASGGPYTVSGLPTGTAQISTYPSAGTIITMTAITSSTMTFVGEAANAGATSLGAGANGISRTVTAGASGVTVNLLASSDTSNPTKYNTSGIGGCGSGVAAYSATSGNTFEIYAVPGTVLTMVADGTITAGDLLTGGSSTGGRVADTGQTQRTSVAIGTCLVGRAMQSQTVGNTLLVAYEGPGMAGQGAASSVAWNAITNPTGNLSLTMGSQTTTLKYNATTGATANLWTETDTTNNTGTGILHRFTTASGSTLTSWQADAAGAGFKVFTAGQMQQVGSVAFSANYGTVSLGRGAFDGATSGFFVGSSSGTSLAVNEVSGFGGSLIDLQVAGNSQLKIVSLAGANTEMFLAGRNVLQATNQLIFGNDAGLTNGIVFRTAASAVSTKMFLSNAGGLNVGLSTTDPGAGNLLVGGQLIVGSVAGTAAAGQISYGATTASVANCGTLATACIVINVAGTVRYIPYY